MNLQKLTKRHSFVLYFVALISDFFLVQFKFNNTETFSAWVNIWAVIVNTLIICAVVYLFFNNISCKNYSKIVYIAIFTALMFETANVFLNIERFYRLSTDESLFGIITIAILLVVAFYAINCGANTILRTSGFIAMMLLLGFVCLFVFNIKNASVTNLSLNYEYLSLGGAILMKFSFPSAILLFLVIPVKETKNVTSLTIIIGLAIFAFIKIVYYLFVELVLGVSGWSLQQPLYALASLGGVSVFDRMDYFYISICIIATLFKGIILILGAKIALQKFSFSFVEKNCMAILFAALIGLIILFSFLSLEVACVVAAFATVISVCIIYVKGKAI